MKIHKFGPITHEAKKFKLRDPLHVNIQEGDIMLWGTACEGPFAYEVILVGTGENFPEEYSSSHYVGTVLDGDYVWHVLARQVL